MSRYRSHLFSRAWRELSDPDALFILALSPLPQWSVDVSAWSARVAGRGGARAVRAIGDGPAITTWGWGPVFRPKMRPRKDLLRSRRSGSFPRPRPASGFSAGDAGRPSIRGRGALDLRQIGRLRRLALGGAHRQLDGQSLRVLGHHLRQNLGHGPRIDLPGDLEQDLDVEAVEYLGGVLGLHVLVHGDDVLEPRHLGVVLLLDGGADARLQLLELVDTSPDPLFRGPQQVFADVELVGARIELGTPLLQALENRALGRRDRVIEIERHAGAVGGGRRLQRLLFCRRFAFCGRFLRRRARGGNRSGDVGTRHRADRTGDLRQRGARRRLGRGLAIGKVEHL